MGAFRARVRGRKERGFLSNFEEQRRSSPPVNHFFGEISEKTKYDRIRTALVSCLGTRSIVLIGMMGSGKSSIGRRLASRLYLPFFDTDHEIEIAANMSISELFERYGEAHFRSGEQRVIARLLESGPQVLATGGGAYLHPETRRHIQQHGVSVWLRASFEVLKERVTRRPGTRPLLQTDAPEETLRGLLEERTPIYARADLCVDSCAAPQHVILERVLTALQHYFSVESVGSPLSGEEN